MAHLGLIQQQLNTDANYRARFLKDPVAALAEHGLLLSTEMQTQLRSMVTQAQVRPPGVVGAVFGGVPGGWGPQFNKPQTAPISKLYIQVALK